MPKTKRIWGTLDPFYEAGPILGRKVANESFLAALLEADLFDEYHFFLSGNRTIKSLKHHLARTAPARIKEGRLFFFDRRALPERLAQTDYYCFHQSDCISSQPFVSALRNRYSREIFPVTGPIHSLSYASYGTPFLRHLWPGTTARDAIVCTSRAGQQAVEQYFDWLRGGYGLSEDTHPAPALERIPLGIDCEAMVPAEKTAGGPVVILVFGRISYHSKMDIVPLLRALHRLVREGVDPASFELVLGGWLDDKDTFQNQLKEMAANAGITLTIHARPDDAKKTELFSNADIFVSIADNPQETFGITLAEAGAFGLPVVASDYDGYRDIISHGETGFLVPTMGPDETEDVDAMAPLLFDNHYHLLLAQRTAVDVPALADALGGLIASPEQRQSMGAAGRARVVEKFAWSRVIEKYASLWERLWQQPVDAEPLRKLEHPLAIPFGRTFGHYTSEVMTDATMLKAGQTGEAFYRGKDFPNLYAGLRSSIDLDVVKKSVFFARKPVDTATLIRKISEIAPQLGVEQRKNHILWALKHDILERVK